MDKQSNRVKWAYQKSRETFEYPASAAHLTVSPDLNR